jgi:hypothetical protein
VGWPRLREPDDRRVYAFTLYLFIALIIDLYDTRARVKAIVIGNVALCIATSKMFAYYPVQIDLGTLALMAAAFYFVMTDRHWLAGAVCALALASREFGVAALLCGAHRTFRRGRLWPDGLWYLPCAPVAVGREELEHRLRRSAYDRNLVLQPYLIIHVRWPGGISDADRSRLETELHLAPHRDIGDHTWEYNLLDRSPENVAAIVRHPLVEDTQRIDRGTLALNASEGTIPAFDEAKSEWIMGAGGCDTPVPATILSGDHPDGSVTVDVQAPRDGMIFFSETYYPDRRAWVDGRRVARMKVNLAFTGVAVPAGAHRIELRYDMRSFWWGTGLTVVTLFSWLFAERRVRPRSASLAVAPPALAHQGG